MQTLCFVLAIIFAVIGGLLIGNRIAKLIWPRYDGKLIITETESKIVWTLQYDGDPYTIKDKDTVTFKVEKQ